MHALQLRKNAGLKLHTSALKLHNRQVSHTFFIPTVSYNKNQQTVL